MSDTIYALATGSLASAVAVVRVSGPQAASVCRQYCSVEPTPREARFCAIRDPENSELIDSGIVLFFRGPSSFTGEDCLEFQVHGSRAVIACLLGSLSRQPGLRIAEPGEFIRRAFDNGKLALTSIEGVADLIDAKTDLQRRQALNQAGGGLASRASAWREMLLEALALVTAEIDFADEGEAPSHVLTEVRQIISVLLSEFHEALSAARRGEIVRHGFRVVLCGPPNAGKSTLLNALARRDVAIVTEHAGTTRDILEVELDLGGLPVVLCDTAGIRAPLDPVEAIGIERSRSAMEGADMTIWLSDCSSISVPADRGDLIVATKIDRGGVVPEWASFGISSHSGSGLDLLVERVKAFAGDALAGEPAVVTNARQRDCVEAAARQVEKLMADDLSALELVAEDLLRCSDRLQELVGRIGTQDILGAVFSRFCMGK
jgi:tRNA modification GTPase